MFAQQQFFLIRCLIRNSTSFYVVNYVIRHQNFVSELPKLHVIQFLLPCELLKNQSISKFDRIFHTYIYIIGRYNPTVRIIDLVSHTNYVVCVNIIHKWRDLQFKVVFERQIF